MSSENGRPQTAASITNLGRQQLELLHKLDEVGKKAASDVRTAKIQFTSEYEILLARLDKLASTIVEATEQAKQETTDFIARMSTYIEDREPVKQQDDGKPIPKFLTQKGENNA